jgi:valyl-tRNA synthetase
VAIFRKLLAPICPFITEAIWRGMYGDKSIHLEVFPQTQPAWRSELSKITPTIIEFNSAVWRYKKSKGIALNDQLSLVYAPDVLKPLSSDLKGMHKIKQLYFEEPDEAAKEKAELFEGVYFLV